MDLLKIQLILVTFQAKEIIGASVPVGCPLPQTPYNGNFEVSECSGYLVDPFDFPCWKSPDHRFPVGRYVSYFCHGGFDLQGETRLTCLESGRWSGPFPKCCKKRLGSTAVIGTKGIPGSTLDVFEVASEKRIAIPDQEEVSCPALETTKSVDFECRSPTGQITDCGTPPLPPYTVAHLKCSKYFKSATDLAYRYRKCKPDGTWSTEGSISCIHDCGRSDSPKKPLIINGQTSDRGRWPWHATIYTSTATDDGNKPFYICGGTLISQYAVLTAAHCVTIPGTSKLRPTSKVTIGLGKHSRELDAQESNPVQIRTPKEIYIPESYSPLSFDADIAIVVLSIPVEFNFYTRPACIPENYNSLIEEYQIQEGNLGTVVGFGLTATGSLSNSLKMAQLPVVSSRTCIDSFQSFFQQNRRYTNFCAGYKNGTGVCNGDSGGGMVFPSGLGSDQRWYLQGIVSVGVPDPENSNKCNAHQYSLFTRVGRFADWIVRTLTPDGYL